MQQNTFQTAFVTQSSVHFLTVTCYLGSLLESSSLLLESFDLHNFQLIMPRPERMSSIFGVALSWCVKKRYSLQSV